MNTEILEAMNRKARAEFNFKLWGVIFSFTVIVPIVLWIYYLIRINDLKTVTQKYINLNGGV